MKIRRSPIRGGFCDPAADPGPQLTTSYPSNFSLRFPARRPQDAKATPKCFGDVLKTAQDTSYRPPVCFKNAPRRPKTPHSVSKAPLRCVQETICGVFLKQKWKQVETKIKSKT